MRRETILLGVCFRDYLDDLESRSLIEDPTAEESQNVDNGRGRNSVEDTKLSLQ